MGSKKPEFVGDGPGGLGQGRMAVAAGHTDLGQLCEWKGREGHHSSVRQGWVRGPGPSLGWTHRIVGGTSEQSRPVGCRGARGLSGPWVSVQIPRKSVSTINTKENEKSSGT